MMSFLWYNGIIQQHIAKLSPLFWDIEFVINWKVVVLLKHLRVVSNYKNQPNVHDLFGMCLLFSGCKFISWWIFVACQYNKHNFVHTCFGAKYKYQLDLRIRGLSNYGAKNHGRLSYPQNLEWTEWIFFIMFFVDDCGSMS